MPEDTSRALEVKLNTITPRSVKAMSDTELLDAHRILHRAWANLLTGQDYNREDLVNSHVLVYQEMIHRDLHHNTVSSLDLQTMELLGITSSHSEASSPPSHEAKRQSEALASQSAHDAYTLPAIYLTPPHGELIAKREKTLIVKSRPFQAYTDRPIFVASANKVYAIIELEEPSPINLQDFARLKDQHHITDEERLQWWPDTKALYSYRFRLVHIYDPPIPAHIPPGVQTFVTSLTLPQTQTDVHQEAKTPFFPELDEFVWIEDFLSLSGSAINFATSQDLDIIIRGDLDMSDPRKPYLRLPFVPLRIKIERLLPPEHRSRLHFVDEPTGPNWTYQPLFRLVLQPIAPTIRAIPDRFRFYGTTPAAGRALEVAPLTPFTPMKSAAGYHVGEFFETDELYNLWAKPFLDAGRHIAVQEKFDGIRMLIHKAGEKVIIHTEDKKRDRAEVLPLIVAAVLALPADSLILDTEFVIWEQDQPIPRHKMIGLVTAKEPYTKATDIHVNVHDCLYLAGEDLTVKPYSERLAALKALLPTAKPPLYPAPTLIADDKDSLDKAIAWASKQLGSEGAMLKTIDSLYETTGLTPRSALWAKYKLIREIRVQVIGTYTKPLPWQAADMTPPAEPLTGPPAAAAFHKLTKDSHAFLYRCAYLDGDKLTPFRAKGSVGPADLSLRWVTQGQKDPITGQVASSSQWRGQSDSRAWSMAEAFPHEKQGDVPYAATYATAIQAALGDIITVQPVRLDSFIGVDGGTHYSWTFPIVRNLDPERDKPDTLVDLQRLARATQSVVPPPHDLDDAIPSPRLTGAAPGHATETMHRHDKCMDCDKPPTVDVLWAEGMAHAWFCDEHYQAWLKDGHGPGSGNDPAGVKKIDHGIARKRFQDDTSPRTLEAAFDPETIALLPKRERQRIELEKAIGDWYMLEQPDSGPLPFVVQHHIRGIWDNNTRTKLRSALKAAPPAAALERLWRDHDLALLDSINALRAAAQKADDDREDVSATIAKHLNTTPPAELGALMPKLVNLGNVHTDWRFMMPDEEALFGWTLDVPKAVLQFLDDGRIVYLIRNAFLANRENDNILAQKKAMQPTAWFTLVTKSKPTYTAVPATVGATAETAGLITLQDSGQYLLLTQKSDYHEYACKFTGHPELNGRWGFQLLPPRVEYEKAPAYPWWMLNRPAKTQAPYILTHSRKAEEIKARTEKVDVIWNANTVLMLQDFLPQMLEGFTSEEIAKKLKEFS